MAWHRYVCVFCSMVILLAMTDIRPAAAQSTPFGGTATSLPGTVQAADFDDGGEGIAYHDTTPGNAGGAYRSGDVDIEWSAEGGYDIGWIDADEWLNYSVFVASDGAYLAQLRVASPNGGMLHLGFNGTQGVWTSVSIPATGDWQAWTTVAVPVTLGTGPQLMTLLFDTGGFNISSITVAAASTTPVTSEVTPTAATVVTWNVEVDDPSEWHARMAMDYVTSMQPLPEIVVIEEAHQSQFWTYIDELQNRTGTSWQGVFAAHCAAGAWTGNTCAWSDDEGVGIFTSHPIVDSSGALFPYADEWHSGRAAVRAAINVNGAMVQVFGTHMSNTPGVRYASIQLLKAWTQSFSTPQLVAGDFNADMDQIDQGDQMGGAFLDSWLAVGSGAGFTATTPDPSMKLDYWFSDYSGSAQPAWSAVVTDSGTFSDHYPLLANYSIRP